ncbi:MAG: hypothetical protein KC441_18665 [Anaerolineales bacterium]|nr:hypothetical protein [Anaerolineales bacterium]
MTKNEEQLAQELDAFLTAALQERPLPSTDDIQAEARLAGRLLEMAAQQAPDPAFFTELEAQLGGSASKTNPQKTAVRPPSAWRRFISTLEEAFTMKQMTVALGVAAIFLVIGYFAWSGWQGGAVPGPEAIAEASATAVVPTAPAEEAAPAETVSTEAAPAQTTPAAIAQVLPEPTETAVSQSTVDPAQATPLPGLGSASGISSGMGGGGGAVDTSQPVEGMPIDKIPAPWAPLSGTTYIMNAAFPTEPRVQPVYSQPGQDLLTLEDAQRYAERFGMSGPVYTDVTPPDMPADYSPPPVYFVFDGPRTLSIRTDGLYYFDQSAAPQFYAESGSYEQSAPIAEAFLKDRGLLDFPYEMRPTPGGSDVEFHRLIDGRPVILAEYFVSVTNEGNILSVSYQPLNQLSNIGVYPLRSAEEAWQQLLDEGVDYQTVSFITYPGPDWTPPEQAPYVDPYADLYKSWQREYKEGETITIYPYLTAHVAIDGQATPRIQADQYLVLGSDADLRAMAEYAYQQVRVTGIVRQTDTQLALELQSWEPVDPDVFQFLPGLPGTIRLVDGEVQFNSDGGESFVLDHPPADIADGERVYLYGWRTVGPEGQPTFSWQNMDRIVDILPETEAPLPEPDVIEPYRIKEATIDNIDLVYIFTPTFDENFQLTEFIVQPAWRFSGVTDGKEIINIFVQAVAPEYVQTSN